MTKLILFFISLFFSIGVLFAQNEAALTLRVDKAGSLRSLLSDEQYAKTSKIIVSGEINALDIKTLQKMSGEKGSLQSIDLSKANIVVYEESKTFSTLPMPTLAFGASQDEIKAYEAPTTRSEATLRRVFTHLCGSTLPLMKSHSDATLSLKMEQVNLMNFGGSILK